MPVVTIEKHCGVEVNQENLIAVEVNKEKLIAVREQLDI